MKTDTSKLGLQNPVKRNNRDGDSGNIMRWLALYEAHLFQTATASTYERYTRVLDKFFFSHFPGKRSTFEFIRADFEDFKQQRLTEGASPTTVGIELCVLRGFWKFLVRMDAAFFNPILNVKVENPKRKKRSLEFPNLVPARRKESLLNPGQQEQM